MPSKIEVLAAEDGARTAFGYGKPIPLNLSLSHQYTDVDREVGYYDEHLFLLTLTRYLFSGSS